MQQTQRGSAQPMQFDFMAYHYEMVKRQFTAAVLVLSLLTGHAMLQDACRRSTQAQLWGSHSSSLTLGERCTEWVCEVAHPLR